ncbi:MAG: hypothetical protein WAO71_04640 [Gallionella sp.]
MSNNNLPDWVRVLSSAAHLQRTLPEAELSNVVSTIAQKENFGEGTTQALQN